MVSGTSQIWSKSGPVDLLIITKMLQKKQEKLWKDPEPNIIYVNLGLKKENPRTVCHRYYILRFSMLLLMFCVFLNTYFENKFTKMRIEND